MLADVPAFQQAETLPSWIDGGKLDVLADHWAVDCLALYRSISDTQPFQEQCRTSQ